MASEEWRRIAVAQGGLITRAQLARCGVDRWAVSHRTRSERWVEHSPVVIGTTTGELTREQVMWLGVLHAGGGALVGDLTAAEVAGLRNWHRDDVTVLISKDANPAADGDVRGVAFVHTRLDLGALRRPGPGLPTCRIEPAVLRFASRQRSRRTAEGVLAAAVQQRLTTAGSLLEWIEMMRPLRGAPRFRRALAEIDGGAQSASEIDVRRMCRRFGLVAPTRQVRRKDRSGRWRFTDCEWRLAGGRVLVLEVDGGFHMEVEHWEDDLARQRALTATDRLIVRCSSRELRDEPDRLAHDLRLLGVPGAESSD